MAMGRIRTTGILIAILSVASVRAQEAEGKFLIRIGAGAGTGWEEYKIEKFEAGYRLTSTTSLDQMGRHVEMNQDLTLAADWGVDRYKLEATLGGQKQLIEAWKDGDQIQMRASMGDQSKTREAPVHPHTVILDNLLVSHFQVLLNIMAKEKSIAPEWWFVVPQRQLALKGKLTESSLESGTLKGQVVGARKYTLEFANLIEEFWAEPSSNRLLRVFVPIQDVELNREGFSLNLPPAPSGSTSIPGTESAVMFRSGDLQMPATLRLPGKPRTRVPVVVLVHGSGPNDRDETIGPNKPFRDISEGLAAAGIATLRYDKRTFAFKNEIDRKTFTLEQEVTDDAVAALEYCRSRSELDPNGIFLLGHSQGGTMVPFIAKRFAPLRGAILMAAAARPLDELILEQTAFQGKVAGVPEAETAAAIEKLKEAFARIRSGEASNEELIMSAPAQYWRAVLMLDVPKALSELKVPVLVLQGGKDVQVVESDYHLVQKALATSTVEGNDSRWFPNLNHLFIDVPGEATGAEYGLPGKVDPSVIETISTWVKKISPPQ
jgi:dienelactone hydrolase